MGLTSETTADIQEAFDTDLADAVQDIIYTSVGEPAYDPSTGDVAASEQQDMTRGVIQPLPQNMLDGEVFKVGDYQVLILQSELLYEPDVGDNMTIDGKKHEVNMVEFDPASVTWILYTRVT